MTENTKVAKKENQEVAETAKPERVYMPMVDICEDESAIRLFADMPGADKNSVNVNVENGVLSIEGKAKTEEPKGYELVGQEYGLGLFRKDFTLSDQVDVEGIKAKVHNGVLELTIPKRQEMKTRKIEITS